MVWSKQKQIGDVPTRRSGHSMVISNQGGTPFAYMFGGCDNRTPPGPNAELYKLDMSDPTGYYWQMIASPAGAGPAPRWHHTSSRARAGRRATRSRKPRRSAGPCAAAA